MSQPDHRLRDYHLDGGFWTAVAYIPFWKGELPVWFLTYDTELTPRQIRIVRAILDYPHDLRGLLEKSVFDYYQEHVFGAIDFGDTETEQQCAPRLTEPSQIWKLVPGADIWISEFHKKEHEEAVEFKMTFACSWDDEHGLGVQFRDWQIVNFGGAAS
jgi:hypothetical protein